MAEWNHLFDEAQRQTGEQFEAAWKLHVARVTETLESGWRENIALVVEQRFRGLKEELTAANEQYLAERLESEVGQRLHSEWTARLAEAVASERALWEQEVLPRLEQVREETRIEAAKKASTAARHELGWQFSQTLRSFRRAADGAEWKDVFLDAVQPYASLCALFLVTKDRFSLEGVRGFAGDLETGFELEFEEAAAFQNALESKDVVVAVRSESEVSPYVMGLRRDAAPGKCFVFPVVVKDVVSALLYVEPGEQPLEVGAVETMVNAAGLALAGIRAGRAIQTSSLVNIVSAINPDEASASAMVPLVPAPVIANAEHDETIPALLLPERRFNWDALSQQQKELHMRAQRFARVQVAEIRLYKDEAVKAGRRDANLYLRLKTEIDQARERYLVQFLEGQNHMRDYLHGELVETLAIDNPQLMGPDYPGPLDA
jgi:hypothetical protein